MKRVFSFQDSLLVNHLKNLLRNHGIECVVKNEYLAGATGGLPPTEIWLELWVLDDARYDEARKVIEKALTSQGSSGKPWKCLQCSEEIEGQFTECWNCGESRPL